MENVLKSPRNGCGLHGALQTVSEIRGVVPIVHANAGCAMQNYLANKSSGFLNLCVSGESVFSTDSQERHVIFGGASRLREQIKNTIRVAGGDLYIVLNSCESAMVGDDIEAMTRESAEQGEPVIDCLTAGFHGDSHYGYSTVLSAIFQKIWNVKKTERTPDPKLVNILGILPQKDVRYKGDLYAIREILEAAGLKANLFFGVPDGVGQLLDASNAALTLVFSKWGLAPAQVLEEKFQIPVEVFDSLPAGPEAVKNLIQKVAERIPGESLDLASFDRYFERKQEEFDYYYQSLVEDYYEEDADRRIAIVGDEITVIQLGGFLTEYFGITVETAVLTDTFEKEEQNPAKERSVLGDIAHHIYYSQDAKEIQDILRQSRAELILGSSLEDSAAEKKGVQNLKVSYPVYGKTLLQQTYTGVLGGISLAGEYLSTVKLQNQEDSQRLRKELISLVG